MKALHRKENINKAKTQPMEQGKILANNVTNKAIISQIYKYLIQFNIKKKANQSKNGQKT